MTGNGNASAAPAAPKVVSGPGVSRGVRMLYGSAA
jgi:hypothetical protein